MNDTSAKQRDLTGTPKAGLRYLWEQMVEISGVVVRHHYDPSWERADDRSPPKAA